MRKILEELYGQLDTECTSLSRLTALQNNFRLLEAQEAILKRLGEGGAELLNQ